MNKKEKFENEFDALFKAKKQNNIALKLIIILAISCIVASFAFCFLVLNSAFSKVAVVDTEGRYLQTRIEEREQLEKAFILQTCANLAYYLNSFDRNGYMNNYNKALAYCQTSEANKITELYEAQRFYYDAIERGVIFRTELNLFHEVKALDNGNVSVSFNSIMTKYDGSFTDKYIIESRGILIRTTPKYPDNTTGWMFQEYIQIIRPYKEKE